MDSENSEKSRLLEQKVHDKVKTPPFYLTVLAYVLGFSTMVVSSFGIACVQRLGGAVPQFELNLWRFGLQTAFCLPFLLRLGCPLAVPRPAWLPMTIACLEFVLYNAAFYAIPRFLPVGTMQGAVSVVTLVMNSVMSVCFRAERKAHIYISTVVCSAGIVLMIQPEFMFASAKLPRLPSTNWTSPCASHVFANVSENTVQNLTDFETVPESSSISGLVVGYVLVLFSGAMVTAGLHAVKISMKYISFITYAFYTGVVGSLISAILMFIFEEPTFPSRPDCIGYLMVYAFGSSISSFVFAFCLNFVVPSVYGLILAMKLVVLVILQYTWLKGIQPGIGNWVEITGAVVCLLGSTLGPLIQLFKDKVDYTRDRLRPIETVVSNEEKSQDQET